MALKVQIKKSAYEKLADEVKALYKVSDDSEDIFNLDVEGFEDPSPELRRGKERVAAENKELKEKLAAFDKEKDDAVKAAEEAALAKARKDGDIDVIEQKFKDDMAALETSWQKKFEDEIAKKDVEIGKLTKFADDTLVQSVAGTIASEISTVPALMKREIAGRLTVDHSGETPVTKVIGDDGKPSALTIDELKKSFVDNKEFASIIKGTNASGGGAPTDKRPGQKGGADPSQGTLLSDMRPSDLKVRIAEKADAR